MAKETYIIETQFSDKGTEAAKKQLSSVASIASKAGKDVDKALSDLNKVYDENMKALERLGKQLTNVKNKQGDAFIHGRDKEARSLEQTGKAIMEEINLREKLMIECEKQQRTLEKLSNTEEKTAVKAESSRTALRKMKEELQQMESAGKRGTKAYDELAQKAATLEDAMGDARQQVSIMANDERVFQGVISGLNGVAGAASAVQGAMGLVVGENEDLQRVMLKVQSLMSITMGLQQLEQALNKDSAFRLVIINGLKKQLTAVTGAYNVALRAQTISTGAGSVANLGFAASLRAIGHAMKAIPIVGWIAALGSVIAVTLGIVRATNKQKIAQDELNKKKAEYESQGEAEIVQAKRMFDKLKALTKGTKEYEAQKQKIINQYGDYLQGLSSEIKLIKDETKTYEALAKAIRKAALEKGLEDANKEASSKYVKTTKNTRKLLLKELKTFIKDEEQLQKEYARIINDIENGKEVTGLSNYDFEDTAQTSTVGTTKSFTNNRVQAYVHVLQNAKKELQGSLEEADRIFQFADSDNTQEKKEKEKLEEDKKLLQEQLDGLKQKEAAGKKGAEIKKKIAEINRKLKAYDTEDWQKSAENANKNKAAEDKVLEAQREYNEKVSREMRASALEHRQAEIDGEKEGFAKKLEQIELDYDKEMEAIRNKREQMIKDAQDMERKVWEAQHPDWEKKGLKFTATAGLTLDQEASIGADQHYADEKRRKAREEVDKQRKDSLNNYLREYGNYMERRKAIEESYNAQISDAGDDEGKRKTLLAQKKNELEELDKLFGKVASNFADLFADASTKSANSIQAIINKYRMLIDYMQGGGMTGEPMSGKPKSNVTLDQLKAAGFSEDTIKSIQADPEKLKAVTDQIQVLKDKLSDKSPFKNLVDNINEAHKKFKSGEMSFAEFASQIVTNIGPMLDMAKQMGEDLGNIFGFDTGDDSVFGKAFKGAEGVLDVGQGVGKMMSGDIVGGLMDGIKGISSLVDVFGGSNMDAMNRSIERLTDSNKDLDVSINNLKDTISNTSGADAVEAYNKAIELTKMQERNASDIMIAESLKWERGSHSIASQLNGSSAFGSLLGRAGGILNHSIGGVQGFLSLSGAELRQLSEQDSELYRQILQSFRDVENEHTGKGIDEMINQKMQDYADAYKELDKMLIEANTTIGIDTLKNDWQSMLTDLNVSNKDFADNFKNYLRNAIANSLVSKEYKDRLEKLTKEFSDKMDDNTLTAEESAQLQAEYQRLYSEAQEKIKRAYEIAGLGEGIDQSYSSGGVASMSEDTAEELNGRFAAMQIAGQTMVQSLQEMQSLSMLSLNHLDEIARNTRELYSVNEQLTEIKNKL